MQDSHEKEEVLLIELAYHFTFQVKPSEILLHLRRTKAEEKDNKTEKRRGFKNPVRGL